MLEAVHKSILPDFKLCYHHWLNAKVLNQSTSTRDNNFRRGLRCEDLWGWMQRKALEVLLNKECLQSSLNWLCLRVWLTDWHHWCSPTVDLVEVSEVIRPFTCQVFFECFCLYLTISSGAVLWLRNKPFCERKPSSASCYSVASSGCYWTIWIAALI